MVWNGLEWFGAFDKGDQIAQYGHSACTSHFHDSSNKGTCVGLLMLYPNLPSIYIACSRKTKFEMITSWRSWSTKWPSSSSCLAKAFLKLPPNLSRTRVWGVQLPQGLIWRCYCVAKSSWNIWCERSRSSSPSLRWWVLHSTTATYPYSCYTSTHLHAQLSGCLNMLKHVCQASGPQIRGVCVSSASLRRNSFEPKPFPKKAQCSPASVGKASHVQNPGLRERAPSQGLRSPCAPLSHLSTSFKMLQGVP